VWFPFAPLFRAGWDFGLSGQLTKSTRRWHTPASQPPHMPHAEECVNDMLLGVWDSIPPHLPMSLQAYLITLVRRSAINKAKHEHRQKRGTAVCALPLDELAEIIPSGEQLESVVEQRELVQVLMAFLDMLKPQARHIFMQRYFMSESFQTIAEENHISENAVKMSLSRTRGQLREHLRKEGLL
jgi:RNA polymerase sigma-70 factor (ECF subfamily)